MAEHRFDSSEQANLRTRAEATLRRQSLATPDTSSEGIDRLVHELQTHQIELEMQNEELQRAQMELLGSRDAYADLYDSAPVGFLSLSEKGLIVRANLTIAGLLGRDRSTLTKERFSNFIVDDDQDVFYRSRRSVLESRVRQSCQLRLHKEGADSFWARLDGTVVEMSSDKVIELRFAITDITERKCAEEALEESCDELERRVEERTAEVTTKNRKLQQEVEHRRLAQQEAQQTQRQLEHVTRVATMGEMATGLAHELNQPLAAITMYAGSCLQKLRTATADPLGLSPALEGIAEQALHGGAVIRRLRTLVKGEVDQHKPFRLDDMIHEVLTLLEPELRDTNIELTCQIADLPPVYGDSVRISQVVLNLVRNAVDAISAGDNGQRLISLHASAGDGAQLEVTVRDTGCGLSNESPDAIFEAFHTTKSHGMGMGLAISRTIIESHNGRIWVSSDQQPGTTFHFTLPIADAAAVPQSTQLDVKAAVIDTGTQQESIVFVVDDDSGVRTSLRFLLEGDRIPVQVYASAIEFLEASNSSMHGCLVLDAGMPEMSGIELLDRLAIEKIELPVIMISGHGDSQTQEVARKRGVREFLTKPFPSENLLSCIRRITAGEQ